MQNEFEELRALIRKLKATGPNGFEGLMGSVLTQVTGTAFYLAKSGFQFGRDGQSALDAGAILFEAKRYDEEISRKELLSKLAEVMVADTSDVDLWIVGSTGPAAAQDAAAIDMLGRKAGIATLVVDWSDMGLPVLATLLALEPGVSVPFVATHADVSEHLLWHHMENVKAHSQFVARAAEVRKALAQAMSSPGYATARNRSFLNEAFASRKRAQVVFGQALAPADRTRGMVTNRRHLRQWVADSVFTDPDQSVVALLGAEGNGKSWLFGQTWLHEQEPPLTLILRADAFNETQVVEGLEELLVQNLIAQTGGIDDDTFRARWTRYLNRWRSSGADLKPRLVVFLDGLNQRPQVPWGRVIDGLAEFLGPLAGKLVLSCRAPFFDSQISRRVISEVKTIQVPEWTENELAALLEPHGIAISPLRAEVIRSLRNPRILGIALDLFQASEIQGFEELSVSRLLFEHLRLASAGNGEARDPTSFVASIRKHAEEIVNRIKAQAVDDIRVFDLAATEQQFSSVAAGRFFVPVKDDPTLYELIEEGLPFALGLSVLGAVQKAERNGRSTEDALSMVLDPIAALDQTADILLAALLAGVLEQRASTEVVASLIAALVSLQNVEPRHFDELRAMARLVPAGFLFALEKIGLDGREAADSRLLIAALQGNRKDQKTAELINLFVHRWLKTYSDDPKQLVRLAKQNSTADERVAEYLKKSEELAGKRASFSAAERDLWSTFIPSGGETWVMSRVAFALIAGDSLAPFAEAFRNWALIDMYAHPPGIQAGQDFTDLIQHNRIDWTDARAALLNALEMLKAPGVSRTGRSAYGRVLWATGSAEDVRISELVAAELNPDAERFRSQNWGNQRCDTDPFDPESTYPNNIGPIVERFAQMDVSKLHRADATSSEDRLFESALAGLARFEPAAAAEVLRRLAADSLTRTGLDFIRGVSQLKMHSVMLENSLVLKFIAQGAAVARDLLDSGSGEAEVWFAEQMPLVLAFPHLNGEEQVTALLRSPVSPELLLDLVELFKPCDTAFFDSEFERVYSASDPNALFRALAFLQFSDTEITVQGRARVAQLVKHPGRLVRLATLGLIARLDDADLLSALVDSGWNAAKLVSLETRFEAYYGSAALVLAARRGLLTVEESLMRMSMDGWSMLIRYCGQAAIDGVVEHLAASITRTVAYDKELVLPLVEVRCRDRTDANLLSIDPNHVRGHGISESHNTPEDIRQRWRRLEHDSRVVFDETDEELRRSGAVLVTDALATEVIDAIRCSQPAVLEEWCDRFLAIRPVALSRIHQLAVLVAGAVSHNSPRRAVELFTRLQETPPLVRVTVGAAAIPALAESIWKSGDSDELLEFRFRRLDQACTDHELATEVIAAIDAGKDELLKAYALQRRARMEPHHVARAVMVAGFSQANSWALEFLAGLESSQGLLGRARDAAEYALNRYCWSRHWSSLMTNAESKLDFWRSGLLLARVNDVRSLAKELSIMRGIGSIEQQFRQTLEEEIRLRVGRWKEKRSKTLFGERSPDPRFLSLPDE